MKVKQLPKICFWLGIVVFIVAVILPEDSFQMVSVLGKVMGELKPVGLATIFLLPIIGIVGVISSIMDKSVLYGILNGTLILSFPLMMVVSNIVQALF
ncbi:hypothetical protein [Dolosigranulum savutiense]|uniref:Uncharacterized protein n=1 Tax=Dolosigranulum savutiense TaxID=3110288 RepID=A0AB74U0J7_9LACT